MFSRRMIRSLAVGRRLLAVWVVAVVVLAPQTANAAVPDPNGRIAFTAWSEESGSYDVYGVFADGTGLVNLTASPALQEFESDWSPDGTKLVYQAMDENWESSVYLLDTLTQQVARVSAGWWDQYPAWSADGSRLIWWRALDESGYALWVSDADGSNQRELIPGYRTWGPSPPAWSSAGLIGFSVAVPVRMGSGGEQSDVFVTTPEGQAPVALTRTRLDEQFEDWSPDGRSMTVTRYDPHGFGQVWLASASSQGPIFQALVAEPGVWNGSAVFSRDGEQLAFWAGEQLSVMKTDGTGRTVVPTGDLEQLSGLTW